MQGYLAHLSNRLSWSLYRLCEPEAIQTLVGRGMQHIYRNHLHMHPINEYTRKFLEHAAAAGIAIDDAYISERCINLLAGRKVPLFATMTLHAPIDQILRTIVHPGYFADEEAA